MLSLPGDVQALAATQLWVAKKFFFFTPPKCYLATWKPKNRHFSGLLLRVDLRKEIK